MTYRKRLESLIVRLQLPARTWLLPAKIKTDRAAAIIRLAFTLGYFAGVAREVHMRGKAELREEANKGYHSKSVRFRRLGPLSSEEEG